MSFGRRFFYKQSRIVLSSFWTRFMVSFWRSRMLDPFVVVIVFTIFLLLLLVQFHGPRLEMGLPSPTLLEVTGFVVLGLFI